MAFLSIGVEAVATIGRRFLTEYPALYDQYGSHGEQACREDIQFTINFLRPALEFGLRQSFIDYVRWLREVLEARGIPEDHVELMLRWLAEFYRLKLPAGIGKVIDDIMMQARQALHEHGFMLTGMVQSMPKAWTECASLKQALLAGDHRRSAAILNQRIRRGAGLLDVEVHLIQPALYQIGQDWQQNLVSVAQEHLATATATMVMARLAGESEPDTSRGRKVLLACVSGNEHVVGLRIVGDGFEQHGWDVRFLGANVPTRSLIAEVARWTPDLIGLSVSMPYQIREAREVITGLQQNLGDRCPMVMIGGLAINSFPLIAGELSAQCTAADAEVALEVAGRLYGNSG